MSLPVQGVITSVEQRPREGWDDPVRGRVAWYTLFSSDITPTDARGGGALQLHAHAEAEIYYITEGTGILSLDGHETVVEAGTAVFIPGNAAHGLRNESGSTLKLFYVFPTGRFSDVVYRFQEA